MAIAPLVTPAVMSLPRLSVMAMLLALTASQRRVSVPGAARAAIPRLPVSIFRPKSGAAHREVEIAEREGQQARPGQRRRADVHVDQLAGDGEVGAAADHAEEVELGQRAVDLQALAAERDRHVDRRRQVAPGLTGVAMACCQLSAVAPPEAWLISSPAFVTLAVTPGRTSSTERFEAVTATHERVPVGAANVATPSVPPLMAKPKLAAPACGSTARRSSAWR